MDYFGVCIRKDQKGPYFFTSINSNNIICYKTTYRKFFCQWNLKVLKNIFSLLFKTFMFKVISILAIVRPLRRYCLFKDKGVINMPIFSNQQRLRFLSIAIIYYR